MTTQGEARRRCVAHSPRRGRFPPGESGTHGKVKAGSPGRTGLKHRGNRDRGAALIEFALIMPLLVLLILGIVDAGWAFFQNLEVRHGAREAARLAAVDYGDEATIIAEACARMNNPGSAVHVTVDSSGDTEIGDTVTVTVTKAHSSLTGILPFFDNLTLSSTVEIRLEQKLSSPYPGTGGDC